MPTLTRKHILIISGALLTTFIGAAVHFQVFRAALVVNTNTQAINAQNKLNATQQALSSVFERISNGLRINTAADDAAGLGVAQALDAEIRALRQAMRNTNDAISLIQTADASANEIANILKRMRELAVQASSETLAGDERGYIEDEYGEVDDAWTELYAVGDDLSLAVSDVKFSGPVSDSIPGTTPSNTIQLAQERYVSLLENIAEAIDGALLDEDTTSLLDQLEKSQQVLTIAQKEVLKTADAIAKSAEQTVKTAERKAQERERKSIGASGRSTVKKQKTSSRSAKSSGSTRSR